MVAIAEMSMNRERAELAHLRRHQFLNPAPMTRDLTERLTVPFIHMCVGWVATAEQDQMYLCPEQIFSLFGQSKCLKRISIAVFQLKLHRLL